LKGWIDGLLVLNVFVVMGGALWFAVSVGRTWALAWPESSGGAADSCFRKLWEPAVHPGDRVPG